MGVMKWVGLGALLGFLSTHLCSSSSSSSSTRALSERDWKHLGVINVCDEPYNADSTGAADATSALQAAFEDGAASNQTVFLPLGIYRVTDTLNLSVHWSDPWFPPFRIQSHVVVGERPNVTHTSRPENDNLLRRHDRPTIWLPPSTTMFTDKDNCRMVVFFWYSAAPPMANDGGGGAAPSFDQPMNNINQVWQGIDIEIGEGNFGAIGIRHQGAQGSGIEDSTIWAGDAAIGVVGAAGGGGSHSNVMVVGGRFGLDFRISQPAPTLVGAVLVNQTCNALVVEGRGPLSAVGLIITSDPTLVLSDSPGLIAAGVGTEPFTGSCALPNVPDPGWEGFSTFSGSISLIDATITSNGLTSKPAILYSRSLYMKNSYFSGYRALAVGFESGTYGNGTRTTLAANSQDPRVYMHVSEFSGAEIPPKFNSNHTWFTYTSPAYVNGNRTDALNGWLSSPLVQKIPPSDLRSKHLWDELTFTSFQSAGADAMADCGALGDGVTDDATAIQSCIDNNLVVILPKGFYRLGRSLVLSRPGQALVGVGRSISVLMPVHKGFLPYGGPLLRVTAPNTTLFQFSYVVFWHDSSVWLLDWTGSATGTWRQSHGYRMCDLLQWQISTGSWQRSCSDYPKELAKLSNSSMSVLTGAGKFYNFYIETCDFQAPGHRQLEIRNSSAGIDMYHVNPEHAAGEAEMEIVNSRNINVFGMKAERNFCLLWIRNSSNLLFTGFGGTAAAMPLNHTWNPGEKGFQYGYSNFTPSLFRLELSTNVTLANLWGEGKVSGGSITTCGGSGVDPRDWSMLLWMNKSDYSVPGAPVFSTPPLERPVIFKVND